jgi:hypothetical protein
MLTVSFYDILISALHGERKKSFIFLIPLYKSHSSPFILSILLQNIMSWKSQRLGVVVHIYNLVLGSLRQEDCKFKASEILSLKKKRKEKKPVGHLQSGIDTPWSWFSEYPWELLEWLTMGSSLVVWVIWGHMVTWRCLSSSQKITEITNSWAVP